MKLFFIRIVPIVFGALILTTLGISAADTLSGNSNALLGQLVGIGEEGACPEGMVEVHTGQSFQCADRYEISASEECAVLHPQSAADTQRNINNLECIPVSAAGATPWTYVTRDQAQVLCARAGKRLPNSREWYTMAVGTPDDASACNSNGNGTAAAGAHDTCVSSVGIYDAIGNVWEWTADDVIEGVYNARPVPEEGYVAQVDSAGIGTMTASNPVEQFYDDYFWSSKTGAYGVLRGGFYGGGSDAGLYSVQAKTSPTATAIAIGFRCVF